MTPPGDAVTWLGGRHIEALWAEEGGVTEHGGARIQEMVCISWLNYVREHILGACVRPHCPSWLLLHIQAEFGELFKVRRERADEQPLFVPQARTVSSACNSPPLLFRGRREGVTYGRLLNRD